MQPLRIAVVGAGPAGLYTADALVRLQGIGVAVDLYDSLPTPFGLLRYGVAPDHVKMKSLVVTLQRVLDRDEVRFFGNVTVGREIAVDELRDCYDAVVYAIGAAGERRLGIPGEDLVGCVSANSFVSWYSGHPDAPSLANLLESSAAVVVGAGNVAVDIARILLKPAAELASTDMPDAVLDALAAGAVTDVHILARRGPAAARFTSKELRELGQLAGVDVHVRHEDLALSDAERVLLDQDAPRRRNIEILREWADRTPSGAARRLHLRFGVSPIELRGDGRVGEVLLADGDRHEPLKAGLVIRSVGSLGVGIEGLSIDEPSGRIPTDDMGRVLRDGHVSLGEYAAGWLRRGATGVLGTNRVDGQEIAGAVLQDAVALASHRRTGHVDDLVRRLRASGVRLVSREQWSAIDAAEISLGARNGRSRTKIAERRELLEAAALGSAAGGK